MSNAKQHRGHCRCGNVSMASEFTPEFTVYCHCDDCRRATGSPVLASVAFPKSTITWTGEDSVSRFINGTATRLFCSNCGSPIAQEHESRNDLTFINTGFMENPEAYPPKYHSYSGDQLSWLRLDDELPRHKATVLINQNVEDGSRK